MVEFNFDLFSDTDGSVSAAHPSDEKARLEAVVKLAKGMAIGIDDKTNAELMRISEQVVRCNCATCSSSDPDAKRQHALIFQVEALCCMIAMMTGKLEVIRRTAEAAGDKFIGDAIDVSKAVEMDAIMSSINKMFESSTMAPMLSLLGKMGDLMRQAKKDAKRGE